jgi:hypothetical protein
VGSGSLEVKPIISYYVDEVDPNTIFGMVGRCGGGYNTLWRDWSPSGRAVREIIMAEFEQGINQINGHYEKLEASILRDGIRNPTIITCGLPIIRNITNLPPEMRTRAPESLLLCEGVTGGSRLHIAQKHNIPIPCIINDTTGKYTNDGAILISLANQALAYYKDKPKVMQTAAGGIAEIANSAIACHLTDHNTESWLIKKRGAMWLAIMKKYGYRINLSKQVLDMIYG